MPLPIITSIPQRERSLPAGEHQQATTALPRRRSSRWGSHYLVFVLALVIWKGQGAQHFIFLSFWGKEMRKKYGQTELNSPSNLQTVTFDSRANAREEQSEAKSPWSWVIKCPENILSWLELLPPPTLGNRWDTSQELSVQEQGGREFRLSYSVICMASDNPKAAGFWAGCSDSTAPNLSMLNLGLCHHDFDLPSYAVMTQHVFSHNPHMEKNMKRWPCLHACTSLLAVGTWHICSVWSERKTQKEGDRNNGVTILLISITSCANGLQSACEWDSEICCYTSTLLPTSIILLSIFCRRLPLAFVCVCLHWTSPLPSLGMAVVNYNYAK